MSQVLILKKLKKFKHLKGYQMFLENPRKARINSLNNIYLMINRVDHTCLMVNQVENYSSKISQSKIKMIDT